MCFGDTMSENEMNWKLEDRMYSLDFADGAKLSVVLPSEKFIAKHGGGDYSIEYFCKSPVEYGAVDTFTASYDSSKGKVNVSRADAKHLSKYTQIVRDCKQIPQRARPSIEFLIDMVEERANHRRKC